MAKDAGSVIFRFRGWMNRGAGRVLMILMALGAMGGAGWWIWDYQGRPGTDVQKVIQAGRRVTFVCPCGHRGDDLRAPYAAEWPLVCPRCKRTEAVQGVRCLRCRRIVVDTRQAVIRCPFCGHVHRRTFMSDPMPPPILQRKKK